MHFLIYAESEKNVIPGKIRQTHFDCKADRLTREMQNRMAQRVVNDYLGMFPHNRPLGAFRISEIFAVSNAQWEYAHQPQQKDEE